MQATNSLSKKQLNSFLAAQNHSEFLQSWEWGDLLEKENGKVFRIGIEENDEIIGAASFVKKIIFSFSYFFCPRGPVVVEGKKLKVESSLFEEVAKIARQEKVIFLRFEPPFKIKNLKFEIVRSIDIEPSKTVIINIDKSENDILDGMHQKTRYNIRLAEKKGVKIREGQKEDFDAFWHIMKETVVRDGFRLHNKEHYQKMLELDNNFVKLFLAEYNNKIIAAVLATFFGDTITYVHGASANEDRNVMAPYLLHWQIIKQGKSLGFKYYDLNGVDEKKWPGVTRFKMGFGGFFVNYPGTFDLVFDKTMYNVYKILRFIWRRIEIWTKY